MIIKYLRNLTRDIVFETIGWSYHFYIYLKQDRKYFSDLSKGISHSEIIHQTQPATDKICIFVLFQRDEVPKHVLVQLDWINKLGYSIHIVSNTTIKQQSVETLKQYSFKITERPNIGYDFGAYQYGVKDFLSNYVDKATRLMLMNDSIFFPLLDPRELYEKVDQRDNDFWGWTENWQIHYHVASYGIVFKRSAFVSEAFYNFWAQYKPYSNRRHAINNGEVKLTEKLVNANLQPDTAIKSQAINHSLRNKHKADIIGFLGLLSDMSLSALGLNKKRNQQNREALCY
jgi:hypothetical protein